MTFGSLFSGIGGFDLGFERAGMKCLWQCEIDRAARKVLAHRFLGTPIYDDITKISGRGEGAIPRVDVLCGGFPCQDLSMAGLRAGLAGERSGLWHEFARIIEELRSPYVVIENVPGLFSSNGGADFAVILHRLGELGYFCAWRVFDAQNFGLAQQRARVFIVASFGNGSCAEILFEPESLRGDPPARRTAGKNAPIPFEACPGSRCPEINGTLGTLTGGPRGDLDGNGAYVVTHALTAEGHDASEDGTGRGTPIIAAPVTTRPYQDGTGVDNANLIVGPLCANGKAAGSATQQDAESGNLIACFDERNITSPDNRATANPERCHALHTSPPSIALAYGGNDTRGPIDVATACRAHPGHIDFESETFIAQPYNLQGANSNAMTGNGDAAAAHPVDCARCLDSSRPDSHQGGTVIAFSSKNHGQDAQSDISPCLRSMNFDKSHMNGGGQLAVAFNLRGREGGAMPEMTDVASVRAASGGSSRSYVAALTMGVRRLTPKECERLQGFPDGWTDLPQSDSPRYRQLGNAVAMPVAEWLGARIKAIDASL